MDSSTSPPTSIHGIPCHLHTAKMRDAVRQVLDQIAARYPKDLERLQRLLTEIQSQPASEVEESRTRGFRSAEKKKVVSDDMTTWGNDLEIDDLPSVVALGEEDPNPIALVAHEFGHVCTREVDIARRGKAKESDAQELAADWYASKWGFGRAIARDRKMRDWRHSLVAPGQTFTGEGGIEYRVTRNFCVRYVDKRWDEFDSIRKRLTDQVLEGNLAFDEAQRQMDEAREQIQKT